MSCEMTADGSRYLVRRSEMEALLSEREALAAHVERVRSELRVRAVQAWCGCEHPACKRCRDDTETERVLAELPTTSLARLRAEWQAEALVSATATCARIANGQEKLAWMHSETLEDGEEVVGAEGIPYSNKALGATHCADEIGRMTAELRRQAEDSP